MVRAALIGVTDSVSFGRSPHRHYLAEPIPTVLETSSNSQAEESASALPLLPQEQSHTNENPASDDKIAPVTYTRDTGSEERALGAAAYRPIWGVAASISLFVFVISIVVYWLADQSTARLAAIVALTVFVIIGLTARVRPQLLRQ
jgi:hypothetical protein